MPKKIELDGSVFGSLTVDKEQGKDDDGYIVWGCRCSCGKTTVLRGSLLKSGKIVDCGCGSGMKESIRDLTVISKDDSKWLCRCSCGDYITVYKENIINKVTTHCGCKAGH